MIIQVPLPAWFPLYSRGSHFHHRTTPAAIQSRLMLEPCPRQRLKCLHHSCLPCNDCTTTHDRKRVGFCFCVPHTFIVHATVTSGRHRKLNNRICVHHGNLFRCSKVVDLSGLNDNFRVVITTSSRCSRYIHNIFRRGPIDDWQRSRRVIWANMVPINSKRLTLLCYSPCIYRGSVGNGIKSHPDWPRRSYLLIPSVNEKRATHWNHWSGEIPAAAALVAVEKMTSKTGHRMLSSCSLTGLIGSSVAL